MPTEVLVLWNASSRHGSRAASLRERLQRQEGVIVRQTSSRRQSAALAAAAAARGMRLVLAAGGDGAVSAAAAGLAGKPGPCRLGVLPLGTANDVATWLGVPDDPWQAFLAQRDARARRLDVMELRHDGRRRIVVNMLAAGNGARVSRSATPPVKARWGHWAYLRGSMEVLRNLKRWQVRLMPDGRQPVDARILTLVVANGPRAAGGLALAPGADPADRRLDAVAVRDAPPREIAAIAARLILGDRMEGDAVLRLGCRRLRVRATAPLPLSADGEPLPATRAFDVRLLPGALRVADVSSGR